LKLSKTSAQAALAVTFLAMNQEGVVVQAKQVAFHLGIPTDSALKILQPLTQHAVIESRLGRSGGYCFSQPPEQVTLLDIVEAIDGPITAGIPSVNAGDNLADQLDILRSACRSVAGHIRTQLKQTTVADLIKAGPLQVFSTSG
jgi:Rrf2 family protein